MKKSGKPQKRVLSGPPAGYREWLAGLSLAVLQAVVMLADIKALPEPGMHIRQKANEPLEPKDLTPKSEQQAEDLKHAQEASGEAVWESIERWYLRDVPAQFRRSGGIATIATLRQAAQREKKPDGG